MRALLIGALLIAAGSIRCSCDPPPAPVDSGVIGDGDPIEPPDAGVNFDAGPNICAEDDNEENDARVLAKILTSGDTASGTFCGEDDDWYAVESAPGCNVVAELSFDTSSGGDLDMLMFDPDGVLVGSANTLGDGEALNVPASKTGPYAVRLRGGDRDDIAYTITLLSSCAADLTCPTDDRFEDNDSADAIATMTEGVAADGVLCAGDDDWFNVPVALGCIADARVTFEHDAGDIDLELYRAGAADAHAASRGTVDEERIRKVVVEGGMRYRVFLFGAAAENDWRFVVDEICAVACPADDPFEPNDALNAATRLQPALDEIVGAHCNNNDFFDLVPQAGCELQARLLFSNIEGDLDLELTNGAGDVLASSTSTDDNEEINFTPANANRLVLRVFGFQGANNTYRLRVTTVCP